MIERTTIQGQPASVAYLDLNLQPIDGPVGDHYAKVLFDDGRMAFLRGGHSPVSVDLMEHDLKPGTPHWLSHAGKMTGVREAIRAKHRDAHHALERQKGRKPVRPETMAKLEAAVERARTRDSARQLKAWMRAIAIIDRTETEVRDAIERGLVNVAAIDHTRITDAYAAVNKVMGRVAKLRTAAIRQAFRYLREKLPAGTKVHGESLSKWAIYIVSTDVSRIDNAVRSGVVAGAPNTEIARTVVGSVSLRGVDGVTEITRQSLARLARSAVSPRKKAS